jgi:hypothetical protein
MAFKYGKALPPRDLSFPSHESFPLLGFPNESNERLNEIVYRCFIGDDCRVCLWERNKSFSKNDKGKYAVNIYRGHITDHVLTHMQDRYSIYQGAIVVEDAFEAQLAINYLIQTHLPLEVINDVCFAYEQEERTECSGTLDTSGVRVDPATGEAVE